MQPLFATGALLLGLIAGSFLNALLVRVNTGVGMSGRSRCMRCGARLRAGDLVPLLSFVFLRGRCRHCAARISPLYPLVELAAGILALLVFWRHPELPSFIFWFVVWMTLLFVVVYDLRHKIILPQASLLLGCLGLAQIWSLGLGLWGVVAGLALAAPLFCISLISHGKAMGWGDAGLQLSLGWLLGFSAGFTELLLAFWSGALVGIALVLWGRRLPSWAGAPAEDRVTMKSEVPFAPFLVLGAFAAHFLHVDIFSLLAVSL